MTAPDLTRRTLSEIASTCQKAARGAGYRWGLAEEAGMAARIVESFGLPGAENLAAILSSDRIAPGEISEAGPLCGIASTAKLSDRIHEVPSDGALELADIVGPVLLAGPLILAARRSGASYLLTIGGDELRIGSDGIDGKIAGFDPSFTAKSVSVARCDPPDNPTPATPASREISTEVWRVLETFAAETLVPESKHSRSSGAGPD